MKMQESRSSLTKENQASLQKQEKSSREIDDLKAHFAGVLDHSSSLIKAIDDLYPQLPIKDLPKNVQPRTAQMLYLQSKDLHTGLNDFLKETPVLDSVFNAPGDSEVLSTIREHSLLSEMF
ncbi:hypothetical protein DAPPUDRAFT_105045 [Daphnia pulex]|uniref:Uncharacterized protein n=1 Tax=Daphnia pulex TaxID=6669 RepID=E9GP85_DAPPU|nr:hypothetical protein DAPPUDRAFT_105045 [Daphnia pulex]|eukprot:EFX78597.1 hypothetical protein DAPPUDRAFT_105045 [Daphnia pulex]